MKQSWLALLNWLYPRQCFLCRKEIPFEGKEHLCLNCLNSIQPIQAPYCRTCGVPLPDGGMHCFHCRRESLSLPTIRSYGLYQGNLKELIHAFKYRQKEYLQYDLAFLLCKAWASFPDLNTSKYVVPVPLYPSNLRERGFNQSERLAKQLASRIPALSYLGQSLIRIKKTKSQTKLSRSERIKNMDSVFLVSEPSAVKHKNILLVDDVCTTGATLRECAKALKKSGAENVSCLTIARD